MPVRPRYGLASTLLALTFFTTTTLGAVWNSRPDSAFGDLIWLDPGGVLRAWLDPAALVAGLEFSVPLLFILLCHELGHYIACRIYRLPSTLPYFLPAPVGLGTFGAFIKIKAPIRSKRELFDVGIAGPIAGFVALLPFLGYGIARSQPVAIKIAETGGRESLLLGMNLIMGGTIRWFHGELRPDMGLDLHPFALAAWVGLFATALNLLPLGQLDGGHILYAAVGRLQRRLALPLWALLAVASVRWPGWIFWCLLVLLMGLRHPPVRDEQEPLDRKRRWLALGALILFVLCFMPIPLAMVPVE